ncbi:MAG: hypothetical protein KGL39_55315 [Patescibacteria group bacterium]|nr:hypothetical protein [Patescibacteria group bacterium]
MSLTLDELTGFLTAHNNPSVREAGHKMKALIKRVESQQQEIDRLKAENEKLRELAHATANIRFPAKCPHGAEAWYCDGCRLEWERLVHDAVVKACEVLGE